MKKGVLLLFGVLLCHHASATDVVADATAKFLAGLPVRGTPLESRSLDPQWATHAADMDHAWDRLEQEQLSKIRSWAPQYLGDSYTDSSPVFYMFSGPDLLYAHTFFPDAAIYILCGTEPVGPIPNIEHTPTDALDSALANLRKSLDSVLSWSFFITKQMRINLTHTELSGTLPLLYVFIARVGGTIESTSLVSLGRDGNIGESGDGNIPGVKIVFTDSGGREQTLYYFSTDLSNDGISSDPGLMKFCARLAPGVSFLKAASYLMHENGFSFVRDFLLQHSKLILQDDSGIPYRCFGNETWNVRFCGNYVGPIEIFKQYWQPDLEAVYANSRPSALDFGFGYRWQPNSSLLMIATRK
jgi:hypothetical protein